MVNPDCLIEYENWDESDKEREKHYLEDIQNAGSSIDLGHGAELITVGQPFGDEKVIKSIYLELHKYDPTILVEVFFDVAKIKVAPSPFTKIWDRVMKKAIIPYNIETRQKEFAKAYELLEDHIRLWKKPAVKTWRYHCLREGRRGLRVGG